MDESSRSMAADCLPQRHPGALEEVFGAARELALDLGAEVHHPRALLELLCELAVLQISSAPRENVSVE